MNLNFSESPFSNVLSTTTSSPESDIMYERELKKKCAECGKDYDVCMSLNCMVYYVLNTPCDFCGRTGCVLPLIKTTAKGLRKFMVCARCQEKLT